SRATVRADVRHPGSLTGVEGERFAVDARPARGAERAAVDRLRAARRVLRGAHAATSHASRSRSTRARICAATFGRPSAASQDSANPQWTQLAAQMPDVSYESLRKAAA